MQSATKSRPLGVTILNIIGGVGMLFFGTGFIIQGAGLQPLIESALDLDLSQGGVMNLAPGQALAPGLSIALGGVLVPLAIVSFIVTYGLRKARRWAWTAALVLSITSIVCYAITIAIIPSNGGRTVGIIISAVIIYYLYRPHVKAYLGKGVR
ncbi:MAG TPA: hypothetical protein VFZ67_08810 [Nitrososphaera sp.]